MKQLLLLCFVGLACISSRAATGGPQQPVRAFTAVVWTTTTLHSPGGKVFTFVRRTVFTRDAFGNVRREMYRPTKGPQHDITSPLERVLTGTTSADTLPLMQSSKQTLKQGEDLGTLHFSGVPATGKRQTFQNADGQHTRTLETWNSPMLGMTVHMESHNERGDTVVSDLSDLHFGDPVITPATAATVASPPIPLLILYRGLFTHIAHMERDRLENDPDRPFNFAEAEDTLRTKIGLTPAQWQVLLETSTRIEAYSRESSKQARAFADHDRAARRDNPLGPNTLSAGRATLHKMQLDLNTHIQAEIDGIETAIGEDAANQIQAYVQSSMTASTTSVPLSSLRLRTQKEPTR